MSEFSYVDKQLYFLKQKGLPALRDMGLSVVDNYLHDRWVAAESLHLSCSSHPTSMPNIPLILDFVRVTATIRHAMDFLHRLLPLKAPFQLSVFIYYIWH